jgi:flagellin-like protein
MKANRKFVEEKEAVSAVIGVILMVAITVAIAATVYVYVSGMLGGGPSASATVSMVQTSNYISIQNVDSQTPIDIDDVSPSIVNVNGVNVSDANISLVDIDNDGFLSGGDTVSFDSTWVDKDHTGLIPYTVTLTYNSDAIGTAKLTPT